ncbi:hypothetical protein FH972_018849 [Carpinus fangiana]|uniref:Uncharacterized protein n=1 Tax=Carpinus fangiana TaxID=176857 RepID=A0A5N6RSH8_9ROSI|nr:hypothetical protein FH972_018849 [Carpinus fangiana]
MADSKDNPHEFWRKETVKECGPLELGSSATGLREEVEKKWPWARDEALCFNSWGSLMQMKRSI